MVADYCGCALSEVWRMREVDYLTLRRDAFVHAMRQTERGREWLSKAWRMEQTAPDADALRAAFGS